MNDTMGGIAHQSVKRPIGTLTGAATIQGELTRRTRGPRGVHIIRTRRVHTHGGHVGYKKNCNFNFIDYYTYIGMRARYIIAFIVVLIILLEYDRRRSITYGAYGYYIEDFPLPLVGLYNNFLRLFTWKHPAIMYDVDTWFPEHKVLQNNYQIIAKEALNIYNNYQLPNFHEVSDTFRDISKGKWKVFIIKWYDDNLEQAKRLAPNTVKLVSSIPKLRSCMFSILEPHMQIPIHKGPYKGGLRYHLALKVPVERSKCYINVNGAQYNWKEGDDIVFDDTYKHYVVNDSDDIRIVMFCDFDRPMIKPITNLNSYLNSNGSFAKWIQDVNSAAEKTLPLRDSKN
jgi:hypothetical protein